MDKRNKINRIYKILPMKEALDRNEITNEDFESYITKQFIQFSGSNIDENIKTEITETLKGIKKLNTSLTVKDIRSSILRLTNLIDRSE